MQQLPKMQQLPNNCRAGKFSVFPSDWRTVKASLKKPWRISYWFYDDNLNQKKKVVIKGMNDFKTLQERQDAVISLIESELDLIKQQGYNRITETFSIINEGEITEFTPFIEALEWALKTKKAEPRTKTDIKNILTYIIPAIKALHYDRLPIGQITKKHLKLVLKECGKLKVNTLISIGKTGKTRKGIWNANQYNHYRKYLSALYNELAEVDAVEGNPVEFISKESQVKKIRKTLTPEERRITDKFLFEKHYSFWRFLQIFFHSGARETELLNVKDTDVDFKNQRFKVLVKKGGKQVEHWRAIKNIALPFWKEILNQTKKGQYLFSKGLIPGDAPIDPAKSLAAGANTLKGN